MGFNTEQTGYIKTAISDLQGSWENLKGAVVENFGFPDSDRLMFHIHEAMSWESVRNLNKMKATFLLIQNIAAQTEILSDVSFWINDVRDSIDEASAAIKEGQAE